jgi:hypothetical protein
MQADKLMPVVYDELARLAPHDMRGEAPGHTLQPTAKEITDAGQV